MGIRNFFKKLFKKDDLLLDTPDNLYKDLINQNTLNTIIDNMPADLTDIEKAYYIYIELGKILKENPNFVLGNLDFKKEHYNDKIDSNYSGICKSISELYVSMLKDKRVGLDAESVIAYPGAPFSHVDTILNIDGKHYISNLISDLSNIKVSKRINSFCFDPKNTMYSASQDDYCERLDKHYGKIDFIKREELEQMDKKLGYSYFSKNTQKESDRGIYTNDIINMLQKELSDPTTFKKHVLHNKDVKDNEIIKYKLDFVFDNINKYTHYNNNLDYLENIRYLLYIAKKVFSPQEQPEKFIQPYVAVQNNDFSNLISVLKLKLAEKNYYYLYSKDLQTYKEMSPEKMKSFLNTLDKDSLKILGVFDRYDEYFNDKNLEEELELN